MPPRPDREGTGPGPGIRVEPGAGRGCGQGRAGVAVLSRHGIEDVQVGFGEGFSTEFDDAGRYIEATTAGLRVASVYLPSGAEGTAKQDEKFRFLDIFGPYLEQQAGVHEQMVVGGDWNICHRRQDLKNWRPNRKKSGYLPAERAFMDSVFGTFPDESTQIGDPTDAGRTGNPAGAPSDFFGAVDYTPGDVAAQRLENGATGSPGGSTPCADCTRTRTAPTPGGRGVARPSTREPGGVSTTKRRRRR